MILRKIVVLASVAASLSAFAGGCQSGGVGDPCTPEDEYQPSFSGFAPSEVNVESRSFQCETRVCLVNHFRGRVSCPLGQDAYLAALSTEYTRQRNASPSKPIKLLDFIIEYQKTNPDTGLSALKASRDTPEKLINQLCFVPGSTGDSPELVTSSVIAQCPSRTGDGDKKAVYCSCRCDGDDKDAQYCECPSGYACTPFPELNLGAQVAGASKGLTGSYCVRDQDINPTTKLVNFTINDCTREGTADSCTAANANCNSRTDNRL